jgi:hypothetical protein
MAAHRKSDRRRVCLCAGALRKRVQESSMTSAPHHGVLQHWRTTSDKIGPCCHFGCQLAEFEAVLPIKWRRGELNPCPRRYPRKHLHVYPTISSEEPSHAPAHCWLPSVHEIDSRTGAVTPPIRQPAVHICRRSRRPTTNVAVN